MPTLYGQSLTRAELMARVGDLSQIGGLRRGRLLDGVSDGVEVIELETGAGLRFDVLPSRGLDIGRARWYGRPLAWQSAAGFAHPTYFTEGGHDPWVRSFGGGLLTTCGLLNVGEPSVIDGHAHGLHGRASSTPAFEVSAGGDWHGDEYRMTVRGKTREAILYGDKLEKTRTISASLGDSRLMLTDVVENIGSAPAPLMLLYHINLGWPLIGPHASLKLPSKATRVIQGSASDWAQMPAPDANFAPCVVEHDLERDSDGGSSVAVTSKNVRLTVTFSPSLTRFTQWRCYNSGDYVLGLEPGNVGVRGRAAERAAGTLPQLEPGETQSFSLSLELAHVRNSGKSALGFA